MNIKKVLNREEQEFIDLSKVDFSTTGINRTPNNKVPKKLWTKPEPITFFEDKDIVNEKIKSIENNITKLEKLENM